MPEPEEARHSETQTLNSVPKVLYLRKVMMQIVLLTLFIVPIIVIPGVPTHNPAVNSKTLALRFLMALMMVGGCATAWITRKRAVDLCDIALLALPAAHVLSACFSNRVVFCFLEGWHMWMVMALAWIIYRLRPDVPEFAKITAVIALSGTLCAFYGLLCYLGLDPLWWLYSFSLRVDEGGRNYIHSFLGNPEYFGGYIAPVAVLCFSRAFDITTPGGRKLAWIGLTLALLLTLVLSGTRGALLGFFMAAGIVCLWQFPLLPKKLRKKTAVFLGAAVLLGSAGVAILSTPNPINRRDMQLAQRFTDLFNLRSASIRERLLFYTLSARAIAANPVTGSGPGTFGLEFFPNLERLDRSDPRAGVHMMATELQNRIAEHAHNDYLEYWTDLGTIGAAALLFFLSTMLVRFLRSPFTRKGTGLSELPTGQSRLALYRVGFFASGICLFFNAAFSFPLHMPARASLAWILVGCFFAADYKLRLVTALEPKPE